MAQGVSAWWRQEHWLWNQPGIHFIPSLDSHSALISRCQLLGLGFGSTIDKAG